MQVFTGGAGKPASLLQLSILPILPLLKTSKMAAVALNPNSSLHCRLILRSRLVDHVPKISISRIAFFYYPVILVMY